MTPSGSAINYAKLLPVKMSESSRKTMSWTRWPVSAKHLGTWGPWSHDRPQNPRQVQGHYRHRVPCPVEDQDQAVFGLSLIHISEPTRQAEISYAVFCL